ncbi:MAG: hypothetical protein JST54_08895 [Deltaproteobacteria bacterium]|nr:hypothetical protein [Deltaproteobacteria bacterium]
MRKSMSVAAVAAFMMLGCSGSSSSSSGSTGSTGTTSNAATTTTSGSSGATTTASSSSTGSSGSHGSTSGSTAASTSGSTGSSGSHGSTSGSTGGSTGSGSTGGSTGTTGDLSCLPNMEQLPTPTGATANLTLVFKDGISGTKVSNATVNVCDLSVTTACDATNRLTTGTTDANGSVTLTVDTSAGPFFGFVEVTGSAAALTTFVYLPPVANDLSQNVSTISATDVGLAGTFLTGETVDTTTHGIVDGSVIDCSLNSLAGATVTTDSADPTTIVNYFSGGFPSSSATATDSSGNFLIVNAPAEPQLTVDYFAADGTPVAEYVVQVAAGSVTTIIGPPNK